MNNGKNVTPAVEGLTAEGRQQRHGLDFQGHAVGSNDVDLDLCDSCLDKVVRAINSVKEPKQ